MKKIEKKWYSLTEASEILNHSVSDLLYLGATGKLELGFDWLNFAIEDETQNHSLYFCFTEPYDETKKRYTHKPLPTPDYKGDPVNRIAALSEYDIGLLQKNHVALVSCAHVGDAMLVIQSSGRPDRDSRIHLEIKDIVITSRALNDYQKRKSKITQELTDDQSSRLFANITHFSELLEVTAAAILEFWEGKPDLDEANKRASNEVVAKWITINFPFVSSSAALNIARIIRPEKYK